MLEWLSTIGNFFVMLYEGVSNVLPMFGRAIGIITTCTSFAPVFIQPIITLMVCVVIVMWVVNIF